MLRDPNNSRLMLSRSDGESFTIFLPDGREIEVSAHHSGTRGGLTIAIEGPRDIRIMRSELIDKTRTS